MAVSASAVGWEGGPGALRGLARRRGARLYLALLCGLAFLGWAFPLTDHLGYELSELIALAAGSFGAALGIGASRQARKPGGVSESRRSLGAAIVASQACLLAPIAIALLDGLRRPVCDPLAGLAIYATLACPSALFSACAGFLFAQLFPRRGALAFIALFFATLAVSLWPIWRGPQVFAFHHLGGMFPGPIYDEAIRISPALLWFRAATLLYALGCALLGLAFSPRGEGERGAVSRTRLICLITSLLLIVPAIGISRGARALRFSASIEEIDEVLGGKLSTPHLVLHFPREKSELERALLARDAEASVAEVLAFLGAPDAKPAPVDVFLYRSADEKRELIGAADTSFTKPWLRQIHTNDAPAPHPILRHELVHALGADLARSPFGVPGRLHGLLPDMAFIEGIAVAGDWPSNESTVDEEAAALKKLDKLPDVRALFAPGRFYAEAGPNAYTTAGSFVRYLWRANGAAALREAYASGRDISAYGDIGDLYRSYSAWLDTIPVPPQTLALAALRFSQPAITRKRCAHEVADLIREAQLASARGDGARSAELWSRCTALEPDDPGLLLAERRALLGESRGDAAKKIEDELLAHPKLSQPQRAQLLTELGDAAWKQDDPALAAQRYAEAAALPQPEAQTRALQARQYALAERDRWPATRRLLADGDASAETWLLLRDLDLARPAEGFGAYLLAKQAQNARAWESCSRFAASALTRELPSPLFRDEALRMRTLCGWRTGDGAAARKAALELTQSGSEANRLTAESWLRRTP